MANGNRFQQKKSSFTSTYGTFEGNELILPAEPTVEKLTIKAVLKSDPSAMERNDGLDQEKTR